MSSDPLQRALRAVRDVPLLVLGDLVLDTYVFGETLRVSREAPVLVVRKEREEYRAGGAANTALNLVALGARVQLFGVCGDDGAGERLLSRLRTAGVDVSGVVIKPGATPVKTRILAGASGTQRQQVLRLDEEADLATDHGWVDPLRERLAQQRDRGRALVVSDYGLGTLHPRIRNNILSAWGEGPLFVDSRYHLAAYRNAFAVAPNRPEAEAFLQRPLRAAQDIRAGGEALRAALNAQVCLLTLGREGMMLFRRNEPPQAMGIVGPRDVTDVSGAGDTVLATFALAMAAGLGEVNAMRLATAAAGVVVGKPGTATATPEEIIDIAPHLELERWDAS